MSEPQQSLPANGAPDAGEGPVVPQVEHAEVVTAGQPTDGADQQGEAESAGQRRREALERMRAGSRDQRARLW